MHPVNDVDALLLLATTLAAKKRPAELVEIIAAVNLIQTEIPGEAKLGESFARLATNGLICEIDGRYTLTADAQKIMAGQPRKGASDERIFRVRDELSAFIPKGAHASVMLTAEQLDAAIRAHRTAGEGTGKNLLVPKPKPEGDSQKPGQRQRKPMPARKRKA